MPLCLRHRSQLCLAGEWSLVDPGLSWMVTHTIDGACQIGSLTSAACICSSRASSELFQARGWGRETGIWGSGLAASLSGPRAPLPPGPRRQAHLWWHFWRPARFLPISHPKSESKKTRDKHRERARERQRQMRRWEEAES
jgi:hypothetical protein